MNITWLGHAAYLLTEGDRTVLIDPWIEGNPTSPGLPEGCQPTVLVVTHGHRDHLGDAVALAKRFSCPIVSVPEIAEYCEEQGATTARFNYGGRIEVNTVALECVPAVHSSSVGAERRYGGNPCGIIATLAGVRIYHAGDTALFGDMGLIPRRGALDVALLPIGGRFTMDPEDALEAVKLIRPGVVHAMHHSTFPAIAQDEDDFARRVEEQTRSAYLRLDIGVPTSLDDARLAR